MSSTGKVTPAIQKQTLEWYTTRYPSRNRGVTIAIELFPMLKGAIIKQVTQKIPKEILRKIEMNLSDDKFNPTLHSIPEVCSSRMGKFLDDDELALVMELSGYELLILMEHVLL